MRAAFKLIEISMKALRRDTNALFWAFAFPALLLVALGFFWGRGGTLSLRVGLVGAPHDPTVQRLRHQLQANPLFVLSEGTPEKELAALRAGKRHLVLVCPSTGPSGRNTPTVVRAYYDSRQETSAQLVIASVHQVVSQVEREMIARPRALTMEEVPIRRRSVPPPRPVENFIPAIIALMIIQSGLSTAIAMVADRLRGSTDIFRVSPILPAYMMAGSLTSRVLMSGMQTISVVVTGLFVFGVAVRGSWAALALLVVLGTLAFTAIGGALAMFARSVQSISGLVSLVSLPMIFLSGLFFPIDVLPAYARGFALALPSAYLGDGLRWAVTGIASLGSLSHSIVILTAWTLGCFLLAVRCFRWE